MPAEAAIAEPAASGRARALQRPLKVHIVTDAWTPQVNGVVRTLETLGQELTALGHAVRYITPEGRWTVPLPTYPEIRLALFAKRTLAREILEFGADAVHIATEGPLGFAARAVCRAHAIPFTTSFHTRFPDYVRARFPFVPEGPIYRALRWFHGPATAMMVATHSLKAELERHGFANARIWSRGVDVERFRPGPRDTLFVPRPVFLYVGRIAVEKNLETFLALDLPGTKVVVGDGPQRADLAARFPETHFLGPKLGEDLVRCYQGSDVFVFPSRTDTFGLVLLEALACGVPVAAYPVQGPKDVVADCTAAVLDENLREACLTALALSGETARSFALTRSWPACTEQFLANLALEESGVAP